MMKHLLKTVMVSALLIPATLMAKEIQVNPANFTENWESAANGDVLVLDEGKYLPTYNLQPNKTITLKAAAGKDVVIQRGPSIGTQSENVGIIFDGVTIKLKSGDHFMRFNATSIQTLAFKNCTIDGIPRCFYNATGNTLIDNILFENCIIKECGTKGWCFIWSKASIKRLTVRNCTLYNYIDGESFFFQSDRRKGNAIELVFENNTVSKWGIGDADAFPFVNIGDKFNANSTYLFRNNIFAESSIKANKPYLMNISEGTLTAQNNLVIGFGEYHTSGSAQKNVSDLDTKTLKLKEGIGFANPAGGDFTLPQQSPLLKAGTDKKPVGATRWAQ